MRSVYECHDCEAHFRGTNRACSLCGTAIGETTRGTCKDCGTNLVDSTDQRCPACGSTDVTRVSAGTV